MNTTWCEFFKRYYEWSLKDWKREIDEGFKLIKMLNDPASIHLIEIMANINYEQKLQMARSLVRNVNQLQLASINEQYSEEDKQFNLFYTESFRRYNNEEGLKTPYEVSEYRLTKSFDKQRFLRCLINKLKPALNKPESPVTGGGFEYKTSVGKWYIWTIVDTGGKYHQLTYEHHIINSKGKMLFGGISFLRWLGVSGQTMWQYLGNEDIERVSDEFSSIIQQFMNSIAHLLSGLSPDNIVDYRLLQRELFEKYKQL